jgi:hypothetical protein
MDLELFEGDDPREKTLAWARRVGLPTAAAEALARHVEQQAAAAAAAAAETVAATTTIDATPHPSAPSTPSPPAHERLYARAAQTREKLEARRRREAEAAERERREVLSRPQTNWISAVLTRDRGGGERRGHHGRLTSYGEMLHAEAVALQERRARLVAEGREARELAELAECRRHQHRASSWLSSSASSSSLSSSWPQRAAAREARLAELRRQQDEAAMAECTFAPRTNSNNHGGSSNVGQRDLVLYEDAAQRRARSEQRRREQAREEQLLFRPRLAETAASRASFARQMGRLQLFEGEEKQQLSQRQQQQQAGPQAHLLAALAPPPPAVVQRLYASAAYAEARRRERQSAEEEHQRASCPLLRPQSACEAAGAHLHALAAERAWRARRAAEEEEERLSAAAASPKLDARSQQLAQRLAREKFGEIFDLLVKEEEDEVAPLLRLLDPDAARDVATVAARLGGRQLLELDRSAFCDLMAEAVARTPRPRTYLCRPKKKKAID